MSWQFSRNNMSSNNTTGDDNRNDDNRNDSNRNSRYQRWANRNRLQAQHAEEIELTASEARHDLDTRITPPSRTAYSHHHSEEESDRTHRGSRNSGPHDDETRYMRGLRTYDPYSYADHPPRPSNYQQVPNQLRYSYQNVHKYYHDHDHRMGDEQRESRHDHHQPQQTTSRQTEQPDASSSNQRGSNAPHLVFPQTNKTRVTYPLKSSLRQPRDDQDPDRIKKKVTFKKRPTTRRISPEPEKKWSNLFGKKKQPIAQRGTIHEVYLGANEEKEWY